MAGMEGLGYVPPPRESQDFEINSKSVTSLSNSHWLFSPPNATQGSESHQAWPRIDPTIRSGLCVAGIKLSTGTPFLSEFILIGQKLELLGLTHYKGKVIIIEPLEIYNKYIG
jgi:hypothetical protein